MNIKKDTYIIIGASAAGIAAAKKIRSIDKDAEIICFSAEKESPYNKCFLVDWMTKERTYESLFLHSQQFFIEQNIDIKHDQIVYLDKEKKIVQTEQGFEYSYTKLLFATGALPRKLPLHIYNGKNFNRIIPFYTLENTYRITSLIEECNGKNIVILGGGISGLECADALIKSNVSITVVERASHIAYGHLLEDQALEIQKKGMEQGITFLLKAEVTSIIDKDEKLNINFSDGSSCYADCIITTLGATSNTTLAEQNKITLELDAIATNIFLQTNESDIFAAGDCATVFEFSSGSRMRSCMWSDALAQGTLAGNNMVTCMREYSGAFPLTVSSLFGLQIVSYQKQLFYNHVDMVEHEIKDDNFSMSLLSDDQGLVKAFVGIGKEVSYAQIKKSIFLRQPFFTK